MIFHVDQQPCSVRQRSPALLYIFPERCGCDLPSEQLVHVIMPGEAVR